MDSYTDFASVYDIFMDETPYKEWAQYVKTLIDRYGVSKPANAESANAESANAEIANAESANAESACDESANAEKCGQERDLVVELGCGTGSFTEEMANLGYDMIGIDNSGEMLEIAQKKKEKSGHDIFYLNQDMRELDLYSTAGTIVSVCDSMNYLTEPKDIVSTMKLVNNFLYPGGIFIFDFNTVHKYRDVIGNTTIAEDRDNCAFIWDNWFDEKTCINEYDLTIFAKSDMENSGNLYRRFCETHLQRGYTLDEMLALVADSGLLFVTAIDADTHEEPDENSERIYICARKNSVSNMSV